jgi:hypothetical protein
MSRPRSARKKQHTANADMASIFSLLTGRRSTTGRFGFRRPNVAHPTAAKSFNE